MFCDNASLPVAWLALPVLIFAPIARAEQPVCTTAPSGLVSWWTGDDCTAIDYESNHHGVFNGFPVCSVFKKVGPAALGNFGGPTFINVPDWPGLNLFSSGMSIDLWFRLDDTPAIASGALAGKTDSSGYIWELRVSNSGQVQAFVVDGAFGYVLTSTGPVAAAGLWQFVGMAVTPGAFGPTISLYNQGVVDTLTVGLPGTIVATDLLLGNGPLFMTPFQGQLDEVEFFNRPLATAEFDAIRSADSAGKCKFGCTSAPLGMVSWWTGDNCAPIDRLQNHDGVFSGFPVCSIFAKVGGGALGNFGGPTFVTVPDAPGLNLFSSGMSIDLWFRLDDEPANASGALAGKTDSSGYIWELRVSSSGQIEALVVDGAFGYVLTSTGPVATAGLWQFVGLIVTPDPFAFGPTISLYNQGVVDTLTVGSPGTFVATDLLLGNGPLTMVPFQGQLDEIELFKRALATSEFDAILAAGAAGKCKPNPKFYCTAKVSSAGCVASVSTSNPAAEPVSGAFDYSAIANDVQGLKNGIMFFGYNGQASIPFSGGTLCMLPPLGRAPIQGSGGSGPASCDGSFTQIINSAGTLNPNLDSGPGSTNWCQFWARDPQNGPGSLGTLLSNAAEVTFQ